MEKFLELDFSDFSDVGRKRSQNEDFAVFFVPEKEEDLLKSGSLFVVADGVGGAAKGEVASKYAAETVVYEYFKNPEVSPKKRLIAAFRKANHDIYTHAAESDHFTKMATTMVAAVVIQNNLIIANVGDSRAYLLRSGQIKQISQDHSVVAEMVRDGMMSEEEARTSKAKNRLSRSIGGESEVSVDVYPPIPLQKGDKILLCSDGLTRYAQSADLLRMSTSGSLPDVTKRMIQFANKSGGADNVTAVVIEMVTKSKTIKKTPSRREVRPTLPEWQAADTQYPVVDTIKKRKQTALIPIVAILSVLSVFFLYIYLFSPTLFETNGGNSVNPPAGETNPQGPKTVPTFTPSPEVNPTSGQVDLVSGDNTTNPSATNEEIDEIETTNPPNDVSPQALPILDQWECVYQIRKADTLGVILPVFSLPYVGSARYFFYESCNLSNSDKNAYANCSNKKEIADNGMIQEGSYLIVYSSSESDQWNPKDCFSLENKNFQGKIYLIN